MDEGRQSVPHREGPGSPEGKVVGAVAPSAVEAVTGALAAAGFAADTIDVVTSEAVAEADPPFERPGLGGLLSRFLMSMGDDLDELEKAKQHLNDGNVLIGVPAAGDAAIHQVRDILRAHGTHGITHYGRWAITTFD